LGVLPETLAGLSPSPATDEALASSLDTTLSRVVEALTAAGALTNGLLPSTPVVVAPIASPGGGTTEIIGVPSGQGVTVTTVFSPAAAASSGVGGLRSQGVGNAFTIVSLKLDRAGNIVETVKLPNPGRVSIVARGKARIARRGGRSRSIAVRIPTTAASLAAGTRTITLRPRPRLGSARRLTVSLTTTYTPTGGMANVKHEAVTLTHAGKAR
jgi:hypothetical protein